MSTPGEMRRPGRPPSEHGANVRDALIVAARESIVKLGFAAASTKHIAARAGVNPAMISYYFGSKAALGEATFRATIEPLRQRLDSLSNSAGSSGDIFNFLREYMTTLSAHPWIARIVVREVLPENGQFREIFFQEIAGRGAALLPSAILAAQRDGTIATALDPRFAAISLASLAVFPFVAAEIISRNLGVDLSDQKTLAAFANHTQALLSAGLKDAATDVEEG